MLTIEFCVPTLDRKEKFERLEASIAAQLPGGDDYKVRLSAKHETTPRALPVIYQELIEEAMSDVIVILADHLELAPDCAEKIWLHFGYNDPEPGSGEYVKNLDRVMGLYIENAPPLPGIREYCFLALGREFLEKHFLSKGQPVYCPEYWHFSADTELGRFAEEVRAFQYPRTARAISYHPAWRNAPPDRTYAASRMLITRDQETAERRKAAGYLWGRTFDKVNGDNAPTPETAQKPPAKPAIPPELEIKPEPPLEPDAEQALAEAAEASVSPATAPDAPAAPVQAEAPESPVAPESGNILGNPQGFADLGADLGVAEDENDQ